VITECFGSYRGILELEVLPFLVDTLALHAVAVPAIIGFVLWRIFITNKVGPRGGITVLGLDDSSSIYSELGQCRLSHYIRFEYILVAILAFVLGLVTSEVWKSLFFLSITPVSPLD
jgi:hypothetical protein